MKAKLLRRIDETKYMKESYEKACEEYKVMKNGTFDFKKYIENQGENKEKKEMKEEKGQRDIWSKFQFIIQGAKMLSFILLVGVLILRVLCELLKCDVNISNETMGFAIIIALMFFFLKE